VPTISTFYGITIQMFWSDHPPPHFHVVYGGEEAFIDIRTLSVVRGSLSHRVLALTLEWASQHRQELMENWNLCATNQKPKQIRPLK
jgi:hypothetical protein